MWGNLHASSIPILIRFLDLNDESVFCPSVNKPQNQFFVTCVYRPSRSQDEATPLCRSCALRSWETHGAGTCNIRRLSGIIYSTLITEICNTSATSGTLTLHFSKTIFSTLAIDSWFTVSEGWPAEQVSPSNELWPQFEFVDGWTTYLFTVIGRRFMLHSNQTFINKLLLYILF